MKLFTCMIIIMILGLTSTFFEEIAIAGDNCFKIHEMIAEKATNETARKCKKLNYRLDYEKLYNFIHNGLKKDGYVAACFNDCSLPGAPANCAEKYRDGFVKGMMDSFSKQLDRICNDYKKDN